MADRKNGYWSLGNDGRSARIDEDLDEEDVWAVLKEKKEKDTSPKLGRKPAKDASVSAGHWRFPSASRMIPRAFAASDAGRVFQQSAPVNIPDWSKIYRARGSGCGNKGYGTEDSWFGSSGGYGHGDLEEDGGRDENGDHENEDEEDRLPPHEWIARKLARSQICSFSVCEGVGRKLKGRDLSKVRNAVLTRTGFLE